MDKVAFALSWGCIYWKDVIITLAVLTAAFAFFALCRANGVKAGRTLLYTLLALALSLVLGRLVHWYCRHEQYENLLAAMTTLWGGFSMLGVIAGCALAGAIVGSKRRGAVSPSRLLDCAAPAGMLGVAVGRLSALFTVGDRGWIIFDADPGLPLASRVTNAVTGVAEPRLATFLFQSVESLIFAAVLMVFMFRPLRRPVRREGDVALLGISLWGAGELVMDSTRYDALYLRSNGFVSVVQIAAVLCLVAVLVILSIRSIRARGLGIKQIALWVGCLASVGLAGYMEYYVQRHGNAWVMCYSLMTLAMTGFLAAIFIMYRMTDSAFPWNYKRETEWEDDGGDMEYEGEYDALRDMEYER